MALGGWRNMRGFFSASVTRVTFLLDYFLTTLRIIIVLQQATVHVIKEFAADGLTRIETYFILNVHLI